MHAQEPFEKPTEVEIESYIYIYGISSKMLCVRVAVKPLFHGAPPVLEDTNPGHAEDHLKL